MVISMADFGKALVTRAAGRLTYEEIAPAVANTMDVVTFDFAGVDSITNSFADEVFGRLVCDMGMDTLRNRTTFRNVQPFWARVIRSAMDARQEAVMA